MTTLETAMAVGAIRASRQPKQISAYGTSEGAMAGWDTRGRGKGSPQDHGFKYHGKYGNAKLYRKDAPLEGSPHAGAKGVGKSFHELTVQPSGSWHMVHDIEPGKSGRIRYPDGSSSSSAGKNIGSGRGYHSFAKTQK